MRPPRYDRSRTSAYCEQTPPRCASSESRVSIARVSSGGRGIALVQAEHVTARGTACEARAGDADGSKLVCNPDPGDAHEAAPARLSSAIQQSGALMIRSRISRMPERPGQVIVTPNHRPFYTLLCTLCHPGPPPRDLRRPFRPQPPRIRVSGAEDVRGSGTKHPGVAHLRTVACW
jgi:hypothetical protein